MTVRRLTVFLLMDAVTPHRPGDRPQDRPAPEGPAAGAPEHPVGVAAAAALLDPTAALGELLVAMRSESAALREEAWAACYARYHQVVWTRVFYVLRSIAWLAEPREVAADVASDVFVGLPEAARHYREQGKAEWWLKQVAVRAALRKKESLTGRWATGKKAAAGEGWEHGARGRRHVPFEETADQVVERLDAIESEELMELERRREELRRSPDQTKRRWDEFLDLYVAGFGFQEIGERLGLTEASARNWLWKIRRYLAGPPEEE